MRCASRLLTAAMIVSLAVLIAWPGQAFTAEFTADLIRSSGGDEDTSKVFIKGDLRREEIMDDGEVGAVTIHRPDKGATWILMPDDEMYMEQPPMDDNVGSKENIENMGSKAKMKVLGKETLNGYVCEKRQYDDQVEGLVTVWFSSKLDYPVKIQIMAAGGEDNMTLEYRNIKAGKVSDSMFEIPKGYERFSMPAMPAGMPAGMPGGMPGGMPDIPGMGK